MLAVILPDNAPAQVQPGGWRRLFAIWSKLVDNAQGNVVVSFLDREEMETLARQHTDKTEATDVLSFRYNPPLVDEQGQQVIGEIAICPAVAEAFARDHDLDLDNEYATLFVHGLMHLAGHDHADSKSRRRFEADTHAIMEQGGYQTVSLWLD